MSTMKSDLSGFETYTSADWDGEGAQAVAMDTLQASRNLIAATQLEIGLPDAAPSVSGAIGLIWIINNNYIYISLRNKKAATFYRRGPGGITEDRPLEAYASDDLVHALADKLLSVRATPVLNKPSDNSTHTYVTVPVPNIEFPDSVLPGLPDDWATAPIDKVA